MFRLVRPLVPLLALLAATAGAAPALSAAAAPAQQPGQVLWQYPVNDLIQGQPALDAAGNVYFGCMDGRLYSLDPAGNLRWSYAAGAALRGTPRLDHNGHVYVPDQSAWVHKVRVADGSRVWRVNLPGALHSDPRPALSRDGSLVIVGSVDNGQEGRLWALSTTNGSLQWTGEIVQWPATGMLDRFERNDLVIAPNGDLVAMGWDQGSLGSFQMDGTENWTLPSAINNYPSNFVVDPQGRIFGYSYWGFRAFDAGGTELWFNWYYLYAGNDPLAVGPADLIFAAYGGRVRGHDRDDGNILWTHSFPYGALQVMYEPVRDTVYVVGTDYQDRQILALNRFGAVQWQAPWPGFANRAPVPSADGSVLYLADQDGAIYAVSTGAAPPPLDLTAGLLIRGMPSDLIARGAFSGETVHFLYSLQGTGSGPCPPQLGGLCLDILSPVRVAGSAVADATGKAVLRVTVPATAPLVDVHLQAVAQRGAGGAASVKSNTVTTPIY